MSPQLGDYQLLYTNDDGHNTNAISIAESLIFNEMSRATEICKFIEVGRGDNLQLFISPLLKYER